MMVINKKNRRKRQKSIAKLWKKWKYNWVFIKKSKKSTSEKVKENVKETLTLTWSCQVKEKILTLTFKNVKSRSRYLDVKVNVKNLLDLTFCLTSTNVWYISILFLF
jgi:hypothetical protein